LDFFREVKQLVSEVKVVGVENKAIEYEFEVHTDGSRVDQSCPPNPEDKDQYNRENLLQLFTRKLTKNKRANPPTVNNQQTKEPLAPGCARPDQWSQLNTEDKKQYDREFLSQLQSQPTSLCKPDDLPNLNMMKYESNKAQDPLNLTWEEVISFTNSLKQNIKLNESQNDWKAQPQSEILPNVAAGSRFPPHSSPTTAISRSVSKLVSERNPSPVPVTGCEILSVVPLSGENPDTTPQSDIPQSEPTSGTPSVLAIANNEDKKKTAVPKKNRILLKYRYTVDQWSPLNPEGKKQYDREFLLQLQFQPMSLRKPEDLRNIDVIKYELYKAHIQKFTKNKTKPHPVVKSGKQANEPFIPEYAEAESVLTVVAAVSLTPPAPTATKVTPASFSTPVSERNPSPLPIVENQRSPLNPEGKRILQLQTQPTSLCKPHDLPNLANIRNLHKNKREPSPVVNNGMRTYEPFRPEYARAGHTPRMPQNLCSQGKEEGKSRKVISFTNSRNKKKKLNESINNSKPTTKSDIPPDNIWIPSSKYHLRRKIDDRNISKNTSGASVAEDGSTSTSDPSTLTLTEEDSEYFARDSSSR
ncbi:hypothetical protein AVEN_223869-1, partial [Araneus ventricosus]